MAVSITGANPPAATVAGAINVKIQGTDFAAGMTVTLDGNRLTVVSLAVPNEVEVKVPARAHSGWATITVTNTDATTATRADVFQYHPMIEKIDPPAATVCGGTTITVTGKGLAAGMEVFVGGAVPLNINCPSTTELTFDTVPHAAGEVEVGIFNNFPGGYGQRRGFHFSVPLISGVQPREMALAGGVDVTIKGQFFGAAPAPVVSFGANLSPAVVRVSDTELTAQVPAGAAPGRVNVRVAHGPDHGDLAHGFNYLGAELTALAPAEGPIGGGTAVTLTGLRFAVGVTAHVGGVALTGLARVDATSITGTTAALGAAGPLDVTITNPGQPVVTLARGFKSIASATVTGVTPKLGKTAGGTAISISGSDFVAGTTVTLGGTAATDIRVVSATTITATTPGHAAGSVPVVVQNAGGAAATLADGFRFADVTAVAPSRGPVAGGTDVTLTGAGFVGASAVQFGGNPATDLVVASDTQITCKTPAHAAGDVDAVVVTPGGHLTLPDAFAYSAVTEITPAFGPVAGGTAVTIRGSGFVDPMAVTFGGTAAAAVAFVSATELTATTAAGAVGAVEVVVSHAATVVRVAEGFSFRGVPTVTAIEPAQGRVAGGTPVTITGTHFLKNATLTIEGLAAVGVEVVSETTITAQTPAIPAAPGAASDVAVSNPGALAPVVGAGLFQYRDPPQVAHVNPTEVPVAGGRWVTLTGTGFLDGAAVILDGEPVAKVEFRDAQHLYAQVPAHAAGAVGIRVRNPDEPQGPELAAALTFVTTPAATGANEALFLMDGEEYFAEFLRLLEAVRQAEKNPLTYIRLAYWWIDPEVTLGDRNNLGQPAHRLTAYIDKVLRAGHDVDVICWYGYIIDRKKEEMTRQTSESHEAFSKEIQRIDQEVADSVPDGGRARVFLEVYEGDVAGSSNHQKIAIFSVAGQRTVLVGGINLSDHYFAHADHADGGQKKWHDTAVRLRGPATDDVESEWMRRWKKTEAMVTSYNWYLTGWGGNVIARDIAFTASTTVCRRAVSIQENGERQIAPAGPVVAPVHQNATIAIAKTLSSSSRGRQRQLLEKVIERIGAANQYVYFENYHFYDCDLVRAIYQRHAQRTAAGADLKLVIVVPPGLGGASGVMTRRAWLQCILRFEHPGIHPAPPTPYCRRVYYRNDAGAEVHVDRAACVNHWQVTDSYDPNSTTPWVRNRWLEADSLIFETAVGPRTTVPLGKITKVDGDLHFYIVLGPGDNFMYTHSKVAIFDDQWLVCGTSNWSYRSMQYDGEIAAFINSPGVAQNAIQRLLGHYQPAGTNPGGNPITPQNIELEAEGNIHPPAFRGGGFTIFPTNHIDPPHFPMSSEPPPFTSCPSYTWF